MTSSLVLGPVPQSAHPRGDWSGHEGGNSIRAPGEKKGLCLVDAIPIPESVESLAFLPDWTFHHQSCQATPGLLTALPREVLSLIRHPGVVGATLMDFPIGINSICRSDEASAGGSDPFIYLTMSADDFVKASAEGTWAPDSLKAEGFIHASPADQLTRVANKHYSQFDEVRIVVLRADRVHPEIRWEPASDNHLYPHIYGPLNMDAAERAVAVKKGADGLFSIPIPIA